MRNKWLYSIFLLILLFLISPRISAGEFSFIMPSPEEPIELREVVEVTGTHQLTPNILDKILPNLWMSQYSFIEITDKPTWIEVVIPDDTPITPPDGMKHPIQMFLSLDSNAPKNTPATIELTITTGRFIRTILPSLFPFFDEYDIEQSISIQTGEWEDIEQSQNNNNGNDDGIQEKKTVYSSQPDELGVCFVLTLITSIVIILFAVFIITKKYPIE